MSLTSRVFLAKTAGISISVPELSQSLVPSSRVSCMLFPGGTYTVLTLFSASLSTATFRDHRAAPAATRTTAAAEAAATAIRLNRRRRPCPEPFSRDRAASSPPCISIPS